MGGTILPRTGRLAEGERVLAQGIKNNPNDWEMYREMAMLYAWTEHKPALALPYAQAGLARPTTTSRAVSWGSFARHWRSRYGVGPAGTTAAVVH